MNNNDSTQATTSTRELADAFRMFNELSRDLTDSYQGLQSQVLQLREELTTARNERLKMLVEKEKIAGRLEKIMAALPAGIVVLNNDGDIIDCNALAIDILGHPLIGESWQKISANSLVADVNNPHEKRLSNGRCINVSFNDLDDRSGQIVLLSDVSDMRALQDVVNQQKQLSAMGEMVAGMAHQVRTPLSTAILYASQLNGTVLDNEKRQRFAEKILERLHHLERQVNDMLVFAREGKLNMCSFPLPGLLEKISSAMQEMAANGGIEFEMINRSDIGMIMGNQDALRGALMNLVNNSVEASKGKCRIKLAIDEVMDGLLTLTVEDNGPGISDEDKKRIFEPFFTTRVQGSGLGLAVADSVFRAHGGRIWCYSEKRKGTVFKMLLPVNCRDRSVAAVLPEMNGKCREVQYETV